MEYKYQTDVSVIRQKLSETNSLESYLKKILIDPSVTREKLQEAVNFLANKGWSRRSFCDLGVYLVNDENLSEEQHELVMEFIDDLTEFRSLANLVMVEIAGETPEEKAGFMSSIYRFD